MASLFGHLYDGVQVFRHDKQMLRRKGLVSEEGRPHMGLTSSASPASEYATPRAGRAGEQSDGGEVPRPIETNVLEGAAGRSLPNEQQDMVNDRDTEPSIHSGLEKDCRAPPPTKKRKSRDRSGTRAEGEAEEDGSSPVHTPQKKIRAVSELGPTDHDPEKDRLSTQPDPDAIHMSSPTSDEIPTSRLGSSPANARLAFRQEVYNAVLGIGGSTWSDIGLISTRRHRDGEEEL